MWRRGPLMLEIKQLAETEPWRAAVAVTWRIKPPAVLAAQNALLEAQQRVIDSTAADYADALAAFSLAEYNLAQAIARDPAAQSAYTRVTRLYNDLTYMAMRHPIRAMQKRSTMSSEFDKIVDDIAHAEGPISAGDVVDIQLALQTNAFEDWMKTL